MDERTRCRDGLWTGRHGSGPGGVTLMEVLISIFILAVGLFGVAALLPIGGSDILVSVQADRAAAVGAAAMREVRARKITEPFQWDVGTSSSIPMWFRGGNQYDGARAAQYVLIDPLGVASHPLGVASEVWSTFPALEREPEPPLEWRRKAIMDRVSIRSAPTASAGQLSLEGAREIFVSPDDVLFDIPTDRRLRARLLYRDVGTGGTVMSDPSAYHPKTYFPDPPAGSHRPESEGNYSWMVMLTPTPGDGTTTGFGRALCSIIVFYKRNLTSQAGSNPNTPEVTANVQFLGPGYGGGEVLLTLSKESHASRLQTDHWILLLSRGGGPPPSGSLFRWYRIVAVASHPSNSLQRYVTLAGPDWTAGSTAQAVLMEGVVGVYTRVIEMEQGRPP